MEGYRGYRLERRDTQTQALVSPLGVDIAFIQSHGPRRTPTIRPHQRGLNPYRLPFGATETEHVKDLVNQHIEIEGDDADATILTSTEAKVVVKNTVTNYIQVNHNSLGVQMSGGQLQLQINEAVDNASPDTLKEIVKTWIPTAVNTAAGLATLLKALGL